MTIEHRLIGWLIFLSVAGGCGGHAPSTSGSGGVSGSGGAASGGMTGTGGGAASGGTNGSDAATDAAPVDRPADATSNDATSPSDAEASSDATGGADCFPACIANARIGCWRPAAGTCSGQPNSDGTTTYCYSNRVTEIVSKTNKLHTFSSGSNQPCFSFEDVSPPASTTTHVVFHDSAGNEVAQGTHPLARFVWIITCGGQTFNVDEENDPSCQTVAPGDCTLGLCP